MRAGRSCIALLLCSLASGCAGLFQIGTRNLVYEASRIKDDCDERLRYRTLAYYAWEQVRAECPEQSFSGDYAAGFQDGVVDHLFYGGKGEPPALPPLRYRSSQAFTKHGSSAVEQWYAGFRHGAAVAQQSGYRRFVVLPLPKPLPQPPPPPPPAPPHRPVQVAPAPVLSPLPRAPAEGSGYELLPTPRPASGRMPSAQDLSAFTERYRASPRDEGPRLPEEAESSRNNRGSDSRRWWP